MKIGDGTKNVLLECAWFNPSVIRRTARRLGIGAVAAAGHSYGEFAALHAAGVIDEVSFLKLSAVRGRVMADAASSGTPGGMAAVQAARDRVASLIQPFAGVVVANHNAPEQTVISGPAASIDQAVAALAAAGLRVTRHRSLGGTTALWNTPVGDTVGAKYVPLDAVVQCGAAPPLLTDVFVTNRFGQTVVGWTTDEPADSQVEYGTTTAYGSKTTAASVGGVNSGTTFCRVTGSSFIPSPYQPASQGYKVQADWSKRT